MMRGDLLRLVLCTALLGMARAVTYGVPGIGSQYQMFGRPITDTSTVGSSTAVPTQMPMQVLAVEGDQQQSGAAKAVGAGAGDDAARKCEADYLYSEVFGKCLPAPGKDGYIGAVEHDKGKGKAASAQSAFIPTGSVAADMPLPLRTAALNQPPQQPQPQPTPPAQTGSTQTARTVAPVRQLRLACPAGFTFQPAMGTCIAPAPMFGTQAQQMQAMRRNNDDDDDDDLRREMMMRARHRMRHRMFGRRFGGGPRILAPVFVFVLPPHALDRNATMRLGQHFGRVHEVHPSLVGGGAQRERDRGAPASPSAPAPAEKPIAKPATPVETDKPKGPVAGTGTAGAGEETPKALRGAFVNPIVIGSTGGKALPLKAMATADNESRVQPLMDVESDSRVRKPFVDSAAV